MKVVNACHYLIVVSLNEMPVQILSMSPYNLPIVQRLHQLTFHPHVTFIVGENGSGKSTLLEALAIGMGFNPEGGSRNFHFSTKDTHTDLHEHLRFVKGIKRPRDGYFLRAESFYNVASEIDHLDEEPGGGTPIKLYYGNKSLHEQSHGESFMALMEHRFGSNGLYILDEPEAALSPSRQFKLLRLIYEHVNNGSQFIIATHSPIIMGYPDSTIYLVGENSLRKAKYEETEHYRLTTEFLDGREHVLKELLEKTV